jgi:uncharacterized membrane protein
MDLMDNESEVRDFALERLMMLTDAVFAIALTLLALDLKAPEHWDHTMGSLLSSEWSTIFAYLLSFATIAIYWASQRQMSSHFLRTNFPASALAIATLGLITLIPFATKLYAEAIASREPGQVPAMYLGLIAGVALGNALQWGCAAITPGLMSPNVGPRVRLVVFVVLVIMPPTMSGLGVMAYLPGLHLLPLLTAPIGAVGGLVRRWAERADNRGRPTPEAAAA